MSATHTPHCIWNNVKIATNVLLNAELQTDHVCESKEHLYNRTETSCEADVATAEIDVRRKRRNQERLWSKSSMQLQCLPAQPPNPAG